MKGSWSTALEIALRSVERPHCVVQIHSATTKKQIYIYIYIHIYIYIIPCFYLKMFVNPHFPLKMAIDSGSIRSTFHVWLVSSQPLLTRGRETTSTRSTPGGFGKQPMCRKPSLYFSPLPRRRVGLDLGCSRCPTCGVHGMLQMAIPYWECWIQM